VIPSPRDLGLCRIIRLLLATVVALSIVVVLPATRALASGGPFTCSPGFYQVLSGQLNELNPVTGVYTPIGSTYADSYNAMGYDTLNNYLYAFDTGANKSHLLKIANDGSVTDLGTPTGFPSSLGPIAADFDNNGNLIVQDTGTLWYSVDVATNTATALTITGSTGTANDIVWIGGSMYGLSGTSTVTLRRVDLSTDVATTATVTGISGSSGAYGAGWSDNPNDLFFSDNSGNGIFSITGFAGGSPTATKEVNGAVTGNNDGAACKLADSPFNGPTANADSYNATAGQTLTVNAASGVTANDSGSLPLSTTLVANAAHGSLTLNSDGSFSYTPNTGFSGTDTFTYYDTDPYSRTSSNATVTIDVLPAAQNQTYSTALNTPLNVAAPGVLTGSAGSSVTVSSNTSPPNGVVTVNANGSLTYTPNHNFSGPDTFNYTVQDSSSQHATATVTVDVSPAPADDHYSASGTTPLVVGSPGVLSNDVGTSLTVSAHISPSHGALTINADGSFTYTANSGFSGTDSFQYTANSGGVTANATAYIDVNPTAGSPSYSTAANTALNVASGIGAVAHSDGSSLTVTNHTSPSHGVVTINADGSFLYTPTNGYSGPDSFGFTVTDSSAQTASGTITINVTPVSAADAYSTSFNTQLVVNSASGVLNNDVGSGLTATQLTGPTHGVLVLNSDGSFTYTPTNGYHGTDSFTYTATDSHSQTDTATVNITVNPAAVPVANDQSYSGPYNTDIIETAPGAMTGDTGYQITVTAHSHPTHGTVSIAADGSFTYYPDSGFSGADSFTYTITDGVSQTASGTVHLTVAPAADPGSGSGPAGSPVVVTPPTPQGSGPFTYTLVPSSLPPASEGTVQINASTGTLTFTPAPGFIGNVTAQYTVTDGNGSVSPAAVVTFDVLGISTSTPDTGAMPGSDVSLLPGWLMTLLGSLFVAASRRRNPRSA